MISFLFATFLFQSMEQILQGELSTYLKPPYTLVKSDSESSSENISIDFNDYNLTITQNKECSTFEITKQKDPLAKGVLAHQLLPFYFDSAYTFDINNDQIQDLVVISYPVGASGIAANITIISTFIYDRKNQTFRYFDLSTFYGGIGNFIDLDNDRIFEFTLLKHSGSINNGHFIIAYFKFDELSWSN